DRRRGPLPRAFVDVGDVLVEAAGIICPHRVTDVGQRSQLEDVADTSGALRSDLLWLPARIVGVLPPVDRILAGDRDLVDPVPDRPFAEGGVLLRIETGEELLVGI